MDTDARKVLDTTAERGRHSLYANELRRLLMTARRSGPLTGESRAAQDERTSAMRAELYGIKQAARAYAQVETECDPRFDRRKFLARLGLDDGGGDA